MKARVEGLVAAAGLALLCLSVPALGQQTVSVDFTGGYSAVWGNWGAGVYSANISNISGSPVTSGMICDDFNDEIYTNETWSAHAYQASSLTSSNIGETLFGSSIGLTGYAEVATLASMMFGGSSTYGSITGITQADLSAAIWYITSGSGGKLGGVSLTATELNLVAAVESAFNGKLSKAQSYLAGLTNLWILNPISGSQNPLNDGRPQEMWVEAPEGGAALAYLLLGGLFCFGALLKRRRDQVRLSA